MKRSAQLCKIVPDLASTPQAFDLYAKVEDLLGVKEAVLPLYEYYLSFLSTIKFDSLCDLGCGSGDFLVQVGRIYHPKRVFGLDLSRVMVQKARALGLDAKAADICSVNESFDVVTAVFDMLNYLDHTRLEHTLGCISDRLHLGGYLLCDINTLYGFEEIAAGLFITEDDDRFLAIESDFESGLYRSEMTLFERSENGYQKSKETTLQHCHTVDQIVKALPKMRLIVHEDVMLYGEGVDKKFLVFQKI